MKIEAYRGGVLGTSVYVDDVQVALNSTITLPEITPTTAELLTLGGLHDMPNFHKLESMECTISRQGIDSAWLKAIKPKAFNLIINVVQQKTELDGSYTPEHIKFYLRVHPKSINIGEFSWGDNIERDLTFGVLYIKMTVNGETYFEVDKLSGILDMDGEDFNSAVKSMLS